ncbi:MAG: hypothetical protein WC480_03300 [Patescibacteria group bacterium]
MMIFDDQNLLAQEKALSKSRLSLRPKHVLVAAACFKLGIFMGWLLLRG